MLRRKEKEHKQEEERDSKPQKTFFILILLIFFITNLNVFAQDTEQSQVNYQERTDSKELDNLEEKIFKYKYNNEPKEKRVERLEEFIFGKKYTSKNIESRINKLLKAFKKQAKEEEVFEQVEIPKQEPKIIYDNTSETGIIGAISQIEIKIFNKTFNDFPFYKRVENLEENILSEHEIKKIRNKSLIERVSILIKKTGIMPQQEDTLTLPQQPFPQYNYLPQGVPPNLNPYDLFFNQGGLELEENSGY